MLSLTQVIVAVAVLLRAIPSQAQTAPTVGPAKGYLVVVGGGNLGKEIWERFVALAGGKEGRIVVVPTASETDGANLGAQEVTALKAAGAGSVVVLHTRDPKIANTESFVTPLKTATGVWFGGGRQWRIVDAYLNTRTQKEFEAVLERGGVIGGTSAGATIQGSFLARGDTKNNTEIIGDHTIGFGYLKDVAIDQHVLRRNRQFDLVKLIGTRPELLGIGIDERTAIVVKGDQFEVIGPSYVLIYDARTWADPAQKGHFIFLAPGERFDMKTRAKAKIVP